jgi:anaerobic selenocysteine-containing dehydrogenase
VPAASIQRVAREFATRRPSVAIGDSRDVASLTAIYALNALVGAYGKPGGILFGADDTSGPVAANAASASRAPNAPNAPTAPSAPTAPDIHTLISAMGSSQIKALLLLDTNPLFTLPEAEKLRLALANVPFIASFASFLDESSAMADLILPSHTTLERWVDDVPEPGVGFAMRTIGQPVVEPRWDTRDPGDVLIETARAVGGNDAQAGLTFDTMEAAVKESFRSVHAQGGTAADADFEAFFKKAVAAGGFWQTAASALARAQSQEPRADPPCQLRDAITACRGTRVCRRSRTDAVHASRLSFGRVCRRPCGASAMAAGNARPHDDRHVGIVGRNQSRDGSQARDS